MKHPSIETMIQTCATELQLSPDALQTWVDGQVGASHLAILSALHIAQRYRLDPLADEIMLYTNGEGQHQAMITVDGWYRLINQHPSFTGMSLRDASELVDEVPAWMECCIYRNDRILPIVVREYLTEVRTEHPSWQQMPRRMLRHRVIQQCARLAFGWSAPDMTPYLTTNQEPKKASISEKVAKPANTISHRELLKKHLQNKELKEISAPESVANSTSLS